MMACLDNKYLCVTETFSPTRQFNSHCAATDCTNIILPTICLVMVARATTSSATLRQLPGFSLLFLANTRMSIAFAANRPKTRGSLRSLSARERSLRGEDGAQN